MDFQKMRRITNLIGEHGPRLRGAGRERFFVKALDMWDAAVKSNPLPAVDTSAADRRREELERQQRRGSSSTVKNTAIVGRQKDKPRPVGKHGRPLSPNRWNIKHANGDIWSYEITLDGRLVIRKPSGYDVPTYTTEQWRAMHEGVNNHIAKLSKAPKQSAKAEDKKEGSNMQKSKLDSLIARARKNPAVLNQQTLTMLNNHLAKTGQPLVTVPAPTRTWGTMPNVSNIAASREVAATNTAAIPVPKAGGIFSQVCVQAASQNGRATLNLTGHQRAAMGVGLDPATPGLDKMDINQMKDAAKQQQMTTVNALRRQQGLPPL